MEKEVIITIEGEEWTNALDKAFQKNNKKAKIDGFRPGHAPKNIYLKHYGIESLYMDAADSVLDNAYHKMMEEANNIEIVAQPEINIKSISEKGVTFTFTLTTRPEVKLGSYTNLGVEKDKVEVTKEEIDHEIEHMRSHYAESIVKDGKIEDGDTAVIDFEGFKDGVAFPGGKAENYALEIGSNTFIPGFEEQLKGHVSGDEVEVKVTFPSDYHSEDLKGKEAIFKVKIHEVKTTMIPEIGPEFFEDLGMEGIDSLEKLEEQVKENIMVSKENEAENKYIDELLEKALDNTEMQIPEILIHNETDRIIEQYKQNLSMQGLSIEQFYQFTNSNEEALRSQMQEEAEKRVKIRFMLEEIAKQEKIEVTDDQAKEEAKKLADKYQMAEEEFIKLFGGYDMVKYDLKMRNAIEILKK